MGCSLPSYYDESIVLRLTQGSQSPIAATEVSQPPTADPQGSQPPTADPQGSQPPIVLDPTALPPQPSKKRKPNASGPRKTSPAWDHLTKLSQSEVVDPTTACNYCGKRYLCDTKSHGTTNMLAHCKICPKNPNILSSDPNQRVLTLGPNGAGGLEFGVASHRFNVEFCRKALAKFVILDEQPFRVVEGEGFKNLLRTLQPQFVVPSRHTIPRDCFKLYQEEKTSLREFLRSNCTRVALTTDCWTSVQNLGYLVLTAHFIDNDWNYVKRLLCFCVVLNHRGETIGKQVEEILRNWGLRNVSTITVDNASSNDVAVGYLKRRINNMNGSQKSLCLDVPNRWNSTYLMLETAEKFQVAFDKLDIEDTSYLEYFGAGSSPPNYDDWDKARAFMKFLKVFYDATDVFSASTHVTIHDAFHHLAKIHNELKMAIMDSDPILSAMGKYMKLKYDNYWGKCVSVSVQQPTQLNKPNAFKSYLKEINSIGNKNELEKYLAEDNVDEDDNFNLLLWWKQNCARFPVLSRMARDVFATPVSTVASESAFSTGGRVLDTFRSCLNPEMAEALICTQNWLRAPSFSQPKGQNTQEELETSERFVRELCQSLASTTFGGVAGPSASTSSAGAYSSQSRPTGCG
ncbi:zinc finger BED domain-containing protein DAYSLEEPER [Trifolium repens]|nr:zinc finger BED domain-containing protein DAYSLEEPER [Trifolium repens]